MTNYTWAGLLLWAVILLYALGASFDFGASFWNWWDRRYQEKTEEANVAERFDAPMWDVTNVFLVLIAVALVGFFPSAARAYGTLGLVPISLVLILLALRNVFLVIGHTEPSLRPRAIRISGITGLLLPALLTLVLPISQGLGLRGDPEAPQLEMGLLFRSPVTYGFLAFGLSSELYLSSLMLADYARQMGAERAFRLYRRRALWLGPLTFVFGAIIWALLPDTQAWIRNGLIASWGWFAASFVAFLATGFLLYRPTARNAQIGEWRSPVRWSMITACVQFFLAGIGYGVAHWPYVLAPVLTAKQAFTSPAIFTAALIVLIVGMAVLFPGFVWFWRLFMAEENDEGQTKQA